MLKGLFGLTPSHRFLYLQITLELEPISKMWITISDRFLYALKASTAATRQL
jgi:hypothetical protein